MWSQRNILCRRSSKDRQFPTTPTFSIRKKSLPEPNPQKIELPKDSDYHTVVEKPKDMEIVYFEHFRNFICRTVLSSQDKTVISQFHPVNAEKFGGLCNGSIASHCPSMKVPATFGTQAKLYAEASLFQIPV